MNGVARMAKHFTAEEILNAFARGFHGEDRVRALIHFDGECPACGEAFAGLADRGRQGGSPTATRKHRDFVARALQRRHDERQGVVGPPETVVDMTPIHHEWLERARRESGIFCRLAIEEARLIALEDQGSGYSVLTEALEVVRVEILDRFAAAQLDLGHGEAARSSWLEAQRFSELAGEEPVHYCRRWADLARAAATGASLNEARAAYRAAIWGYRTLRFQDDASRLLVELAEH